MVISFLQLREDVCPGAQAEAGEKGWPKGTAAKGWALKVGGKMKYSFPTTLDYRSSVKDAKTPRNSSQVFQPFQ